MQDSLKEKLEVVYICTSSEINFISPIIAESPEDDFSFLNSKPVGISLSTFRPPAAIL